MIPLNLNYNYKDIFLAPRLALSGKKILLILKKKNLFRRRRESELDIQPTTFFFWRYSTFYKNS